MNKSKIIATIIVATLLGITMVGVKHIKSLDNQIQLKQIDLKDNSAKLKLLDKKYTDLNKELDKKNSDKAKIEQDLKNLQQERDTLQAQLQTKIDAKAKDIAVKATQAVGAPQVAYAATCGDAKSCIYSHESGNNPGSINASSGACGIGQAWPCSKMGCSLSDYVCQDAFFTNYAIQRYGGWEQAWSFWQANHYW
jgi:peptidoglycan hydrolase CwlO-like protein